MDGDYMEKVKENWKSEKQKYETVNIINDINWSLYNIFHWIWSLTWVVR